MNNNQENIDKIFKNTLSDYEVESPAGEWEAIKYDLDKADKQSKIIFIYRFAAIFLLFTLLASAYIIFNFKNIKNKNFSNGLSEKTALYKTKKDTKPVKKHYENIKNNNINLQDKVSYKQPNKNNTTNKVSNTNINEKQAIAEKNTEQIEIIATIEPKPPKINRKVKASQEIIFPKEYIENVINEIYNQTAENSEKKPKNFDKWEVGGQFAPVYSYRQSNINNALVKAGTNLGSVSEISQNLKSLEKSAIVFSGGFKVNFKPSKKLSIQSGIYYSQYGYIQNNVNLNYNYDGVASAYNQIYTSQGVLIIAPKSSEVNQKNITNNREELNSINLYNDRNNQISEYVITKDVTQLFNYFEMPLVLKYAVFDKKIKLELMGGLGANVYLNNIVYVPEKNGRQILGETTTPTNIFNYSGIMGIGFNYPILPKLIFNIEPSFKYFINSSYKDLLLKSHPYAFSFYTGLNYKF
jgi:hypothetical protein